MSLLLAMVALPFFVQAQVLQDSVAEVKEFEFEVRCGATFPLEKVFGNNCIGGNMGIEARWNMKEIPLDFGLEMNVAVNVSEYGNSDSSRPLTSFAAVTDYNFLRGQRVSPFVGAGFGWCVCDVVENGGYKKNGNCCMFMLRGGVELFRHLRVTLNTRIAKKGYNHIGLTLGYAFGGGLKKKK